MTTPELEAVARAICIENLKGMKYSIDDGTVDSYWPSFVADARAALSAIRIPTERMHAAASNAPTASTVGGVRRNEHAAMIDSILGNGGEP